MKKLTHKDIGIEKSKMLDQQLFDICKKSIDEYIEAEALRKGVDVDTYLSQLDDIEETSFEHQKKDNKQKAEPTFLWEKLADSLDDYYRFVRRSKRKTNTKYTVKRGK